MKFRVLCFVFLMSTVRRKETGKWILIVVQKACDNWCEVSLLIQTFCAVVYLYNNLHCLKAGGGIND